jgi:hypothetical protein
MKMGNSMKTGDRMSAAWRVIGASVQGVSHVKSGHPCQDAHAWSVLPNETLLAAVADGAGSAVLAEVGAQLAVHAAVNFLRSELVENASPSNEAAWQALLFEALKAARQRLEDETQTRDCALRDLATTLIVAVVTGELALSTHVGDGAAVLYTEDELLLLAAPQASEYVNETTFLVSADYLNAAQFSSWRGRAKQLALFTDGLQRLALQMPLQRPHAPFFTPLFQFAAQAGTEAEAQLEAFLRSPRIAERADDDLTLLLAARV